MSVEVHTISYPLQSITNVSNCKSNALYLSFLADPLCPSTIAMRKFIMPVLLPVLCQLWLLCIIYLCCAVVILPWKIFHGALGLSMAWGQILYAKILCWLEALQLLMKTSRAAAVSVLDEDPVMPQARELRMMHRFTELRCWAGPTWCPHCTDPGAEPHPKPYAKLSNCTDVERHQCVCRCFTVSSSSRFLPLLITSSAKNWILCLNNIDTCFFMWQEMFCRWWFKQMLVAHVSKGRT